jgi:hypothetical protein
MTRNPNRHRRTGHRLEDTPTPYLARSLGRESAREPGSYLANQLGTRSARYPDTLGRDRETRRNHSLRRNPDSRRNCETRRNRLESDNKRAGRLSPLQSIPTLRYRGRLSCRACIRLGARCSIRLSEKGVTR